LDFDRKNLGELGGVETATWKKEGESADTKSKSMEGTCASQTPRRKNKSVAVEKEENFPNLGGFGEGAQGTPGGPRETRKDRGGERITNADCPCRSIGKSRQKNKAKPVH